MAQMNMEVTMKNRFRTFWSKLDQGGLRIAALYMLVGGGWILFSDNLAAVGTQTDRISVTVSIYKGWGFMLVTGIMLYFLIQRDNHSLRAVNKNYLLLAENISDVIWVLDLNTSSFTYISPSIQQLRGLTFKEAMSETMQDSVSPASWEYLTSILPIRIEEFQRGTIRSYTDQLEQCRKDGSMIYVEVTSRFVVNSENGHLEVYGASRDINERKITEQKLHLSEETYHYLFLNHPHPMWIYDLETLSFLEVNEAAIAKYGYSRPEFLQMSIKDIRPEEELRRLMENLAQPRQSIEYSEGWHHRLKDGRLIDVSITSHSLQFNGHASALVVAQDITERKRAEEKLSASEARFFTVFHSSPIGITLTRLTDGFINDVNEAFLNMFGFTREEVIGRHTIELEIYANTTDRDRLVNLIRDQGGIHGLEVQFRRRSGEIGNLLVSAEVIELAGEQCLLSMLFDITERKRAEDAIRENARQMKAVVTSLDDIVFEFDEQGTYINVWTADESLLALPKSQLIGKQILEVLGEENGRPFAEAVKRVAMGGSTESIEYPLEVIGGKHWFVARISPILTENAPANTVSMLVRDITVRKQAEHQVQLQLQRMSVLNEIDQAISSRLDIRLSLEFLLGGALTQLGVDAASIMLLNTSNQMLEYCAGKGFQTQSIRQSRLRIGEGLLGQIGGERKVIHVSNLAGEGDRFKRAELLKQEEFVEYYGIPLIAKGLLKGVLEIFNRSPLTPDSGWVDYLETLGRQAAIAIDNAQLFEGIQQSNFELFTAYDATIAGWSHAMDLRDKETEGHSQRVTELTLKLAEKMGVNSQDRIHIRRGALLHDIGKIGVPDEILHKPGPLTEEEWGTMRQHPTHAFNMLASISYLRLALDIPYCHHEKWDGSGYPRGLKGEQIPLAARIFAIVDVWDALRSDRPYRESWSENKVLDYIRSLVGIHFDPKVVKNFLELMDGQ